MPQPVNAHLLEMCNLLCTCPPDHGKTIYRTECHSLFSLSSTPAHTETSSGEPPSNSYWSNYGTISSNNGYSYYYHWIKNQQTDKQQEQCHWGSFSNRSKFPVRFRVWTVATCCTTTKTRTITIGLIHHQQQVFPTSQRQLQSGIRVQTIWWDARYIDSPIFSAFPPPVFRFAIWPLLIQSLSKTCEFRINVLLTHSDSTNSGPITNLNAGGLRVGKTWQSTYRWYHNTIRTQILNWSQSWRNHQIEP